LARFGQDIDKDVQGISPDALNLLINYPWPGNVRQLQSVLKQALVQATGPVLVADFFPSEIRSPHAAEDGTAGATGERGGMERLIENRLQAGSQNLYAESLEMLERVLITAVLKNTHGNQSKAAEILGITRGSLRNKIRALGIYIDRKIGSDGDAIAELVSPGT
jgi:DNA-binding NtrC family response regulator